MRQIFIPPTITIDSTERTPRGPVATSTPFTLFQFLAAMLLSDRRFNSNAEGAFAAERITALMKGYGDAWQTYDVAVSNANAVQAHINDTYNAAFLKSANALQEWSHEVARLESEADAGYEAALQEFDAECMRLDAEADAAHDAAVQAWRDDPPDAEAREDVPAPERVAPVKPPPPVRIFPPVVPRPEEPPLPASAPMPDAPRFLLTDDDAELLAAAVAEPTDGYPIKPVFVIASYLRAVADHIAAK